MKSLKNIVIALCVLSASGCVIKPDSLVVNGLSKHINESGKDEKNIGLGVRYKNYEIGVYDNSRIRKSLSYYVANRFYKNGGWFADRGISYYEKGDGYSDMVKPFVKLGYAWSGLELAYAPTNLLTLQYNFRLKQ